MATISGNIRYHNDSLWSGATLYVATATDIVDGIVYPRSSMQIRADEQGLVSFELVPGNYALALGAEWYGFTVADADADLDLAKIISVDNRISVEAVEKLSLDIGVGGLATQENVAQQIEEALNTLPSGLSQQAQEDARKLIEDALNTLPSGLSQQAQEDARKLIGEALNTLPSGLSQQAQEDARKLIEEALNTLPSGLSHVDVEQQIQQALSARQKTRIYTYETPKGYSLLKPFQDWEYVPPNLIDFVWDEKQGIATATVIEFEWEPEPEPQKFITEADVQRLIRQALADADIDNDGSTSPLVTYELQQPIELRATTNISTDSQSGLSISNIGNDWTQIALLTASDGVDFEISREQVIEIIFKLNNETKWLIGLAPSALELTSVSGTAFDYASIALYVRLSATHYFYGSNKWRHSVTASVMTINEFYKVRFQPRAAGGIDFTLYQLDNDFVQTKKIIEATGLNIGDQTDRFYPCVLPGSGDLGGFELIAIRK